MNNKKFLLASLLLVVLTLAPLANQTFATTNNKGKSLVKEVGIQSFVKHDWTITTSDFSYTSTGTTIPEELTTMLPQIAELFNGLEMGKFVIVIGKDYPTDEVAYVTPYIILGNDVEVFAETLSLALNISLEDAQNLEFTIPKGSGIAPTLFASFMFFEGEMGPPVGPQMLSKAFLADDFKLSQFEEIPTVTAMPYNYSAMAITPPAPLLKPAYFSTYAMLWEMIVTNMTPMGITGEAEDLGTEYKFSLYGTNTTTNEEGVTQTVTVDFFVKYKKSTGVLSLLYLDLTLEATDGVSTLTASIHFLMGYNGYTELNFGLSDGDKIGFTPTKFDYPEALVDFLEMISEGEINATVLQMIKDYILSTNITLEYMDDYSISGIDLLYNATAELYDFESGNPSLVNLGPVMMSDLLFGAPYVLPVWDEMASVAQLELFIIIDVLGNFASYFAEKEEPNISFGLSGNFNILVHGTEENFDYISAYTTVSFQFTNSSPYGISVEGSLEEWSTYSSDGLLTEVGLYINITDITFDTNGNGDFSDEFMHFSFYLDISINRVASAGGGLLATLGEPDFSNPIDAPDPEPGAAGWTDITPMNQEQPPGEVPDTVPPTINVTVIPEVPAKGDEVKVKAAVSDESEVTQVIFSYQNGTDWINVTMTYNETSGYYEATFTMPDDQVNAKIYAQDIYGNWATHEFTIGQAPAPGGVPQTYLYVGGGVLALIVIVAIIAMVRRRG